MMGRRTEAHAFFEQYLLVFISTADVGGLLSPQEIVQEHLLAADEPDILRVGRA